MAIKPEQIARIKGFGNIYSVKGDLEGSIKALKKVGIKYPYFTSLRDAAFLTLNRKNINFRDARTSHAIVYEGESFERTPIIILRNSPLLRKGFSKKYFRESSSSQTYSDIGYIRDPCFYGKCLDMAIEDSFKDISKRRAISIEHLAQTKDIKGDSKIAHFLFGNQRTKYFDQFAIWKRGIDYVRIPGKYIELNLVKLDDYPKNDPFRGFSSRIYSVWLGFNSQVYADGFYSGGLSYNTNSFAIKKKLISKL